ncbi:glutathione S-transferase family protein [Mangrovibacter sp. SLW1]
MLTVWGRKTSSNVQALMWCIGELNLPVNRIDVGHRFGGNDTPDFLAMNPNGTVPVLQDGLNEPMWETGAVLRYLAYEYGAQSFWPQNNRERAQVDKWAEWAKLNIALNFTAPVFWRVVRTPAAQRDEAAIAAALKTLHHFMAIAEKQLEHHAWLAGDQFSLADIQFGHILYRYYDIAIDRPVFPAIEACYQRLHQRKAWLDHVQVSYEELRAG